MQTTVNSQLVENVLGAELEKILEEFKGKWEEFDKLINTVDTVIRSEEVRFRDWITFKQCTKDYFDDFLYEFILKKASTIKHKSVVLDLEKKEVYLVRRTEKANVDESISDKLITLVEFDNLWFDIKTYAPGKMTVSAVNKISEDVMIDFDFTYGDFMHKWRCEYSERKKTYHLMKVMEKRGKK